MLDTYLAIHRLGALSPSALAPELGRPPRVADAGHADAMPAFRGHLLGDNAYWPRQAKREKLAQKGITVTAVARSNWKVKNTPEEKALLKKWRGQVERRIGLFDCQFHAGRTLCRHHAERQFKVESLRFNV